MTNKMAPLDLQNDEAFLSLLSSQRQLLNQLNMENAMKREQQANAMKLGHSKRGSFLGSTNLDPLSLMNRPIIERRSSIDYLWASRRLSIGIGNDQQNMFPGLFSDFEEPSLKPSWDSQSALSSRTMKRRRSSLGLLSGLVFDDHPQSRRLSLLSNFSKPTEFEEERFMDDDVFAFEKFEPVCKQAKIEPNFQDPKELKIKMEAFADAMEKSAKSQQDIHDWDRKMGLKRSHSKTMRMTMRSRKKLRNLMKKELNAIMHAR